MVTNTLPIPSEKEIDKLEVLSIAPTIAHTIKAVFEEASVMSSSTEKTSPNPPPQKPQGPGLVLQLRRSGRPVCKTKPGSGAIFDG